MNNLVRAGGEDTSRPPQDRKTHQQQRNPTPDWNQQRNTERSHDKNWNRDQPLAKWQKKKELIGPAQWRKCRGWPRIRLANLYRWPQLMVAAWINSTLQKSSSLTGRVNQQTLTQLSICSTSWGEDWKEKAWKEKATSYKGAWKGLMKQNETGDVRWSRHMTWRTRTWPTASPPAFASSDEKINMSAEPFWTSLV